MRDLEGVPPPAEKFKLIKFIHAVKIPKIGSLCMIFFLDPHMLIQLICRLFQKYGYLHPDKFFSFADYGLFSEMLKAIYTCMYFYIYTHEITERDRIV